MSQRPPTPLTDRRIRDGLTDDGEAPVDLARSISDYAHSTPQQSGRGLLGWLGARPLPAGGRQLALVLLLVALLLAIGVAALVGSRPQRLAVVPPSPAPLVTLAPTTGPSIPAGWSHVGNVPRQGSDGVGFELDGLLVFVNAERGELAFFDPAAGDGGRIVERVDLEGSGRGLPIARDPEGWWIGIGFNHELVRFDPASRSVVRRIPIGAEPYNLATDGDIVYVTDFENGRLLRVDTSTGEVTASRDLAQAAGVAVLADGRVLAASRPGSLLEVDPVTLATLDEVAVQGDLMNLIADGDRVIITRNNADRLSTINPSGLAAGEALTTTRISALALTDDSAWAIDWITGDILRLDRDSLEVAERMPALSEGQDGIAVAAGDLWVEGTTDDGPVAHRVRPPAEPALP